MAQTKPEYEGIDEFKIIATKLVNKYPDVLDGINPSLIRCVGITNKEPNGKKPVWELRAVPMPIRLECPYDYFVIVNMQSWISLEEKHKALLVFDVLCSVSPDGEGKVLPFDLKDHSVVLRTVGVDYMQRSEVPNILTDDIQWKKDS